MAVCNVRNLSSPPTTESIDVVGITTGTVLNHNLDGNVAIQFVDSTNEFLGGFRATNLTSSTFSVTVPFGTPPINGTVVAFKI